jgi:hypothetical protein
MSDSFSTRFTGWSFLTAAVLLWGGWMILPVKIGTYFEPELFARIHDVFRFWIWAYRMHIFGMVITVIALVALASLVTESPCRVMVWPGTAVATAGMIVGALGAAFYYHHGAWGAQELRGKTPTEVAEFVAALRVDTEYVTCLVRFGRVFTGLGLVFIACGLWRGKILPVWLCGFAIVLGVAAMALTMLLPDRLELYPPVFHAFSLWLALTGVTILRGGLKLPAQSDGR